MDGLRARRGDRRGARGRGPPGWMSRLTSALAVAGAAGGAYLGARAVMSPQARFARMSRLVDRRARRGRLDHGLPQRRLLPPRARRARRWRTCGSLSDRHDALAPARQRRLHGRDVVGFHRAFGRERIGTAVTARGTLDRDQLLAGAARLLGDWFPDASRTTRAAAGASRSRPPRRVRRTTRASACASHGSARSRRARSRPSSRSGTRTRRSRSPARTRSSARCSRPRPGPTTRARSVASRRCAAAGSPGRRSRSRSRPGPRPAARCSRAATSRSRGCVTPDDEADLRAYVDELNDGLARFGRDEPPAVPGGAQPIVGFDLTTHEGHFIGARQQPARALRAATGRRTCARPGRGTRCRATSPGRTTLAGRQAQPSSGARPSDRRADRCSTRSPSRSPRRRARVSATRDRHRRGPERAHGRDHARRRRARRARLEAASEPGGAVRTQELTLPGFRHDIFSSVYPAGAASPVFARLGLERHGLRWVHPRATARRTCSATGAPRRCAATSPRRRRASTRSRPATAIAGRGSRALPAALRRGARTRCSRASRRSSGRRSSPPGWARGRRSSSRA